MSISPMVTNRVKDVSEQVGEIPKLGLFSHFGIFKQNLLKDNYLSYNDKKYTIPHYPLDSELNKDYTEEEFEHKISQLKSRAGQLFEVAFATCITQGDVYAPSKTVNYNWYAESNTSQVKVEANVIKVVDRELDERNSPHKTSADNVVSYYKSLGYEGKIYGFASPQAFVKLKQEGFVEVETDTQRYQKLCNGVVDIYNYRGIYFDRDSKQQPFIEAETCVFIPQDLNIASVNFGPASTFDAINKEALTLYMQVYEAEDRVEVMSETNFICVLEKPEYVVHIKY